MGQSVRSVTYRQGNGRIIGRPSLKSEAARPWPEGGQGLRARLIAAFLPLQIASEFALQCHKCRHNWQRTMLVLQPRRAEVGFAAPPCAIADTGSCTLPDMHACHADVRMPAEAHQRACQTDLDSSSLLQGWAHMRRRGTLRVANLEKMHAASGLACLHSSFRKAGNCRQSTHTLTDVLRHIDTSRPQCDSMQFGKQGAVRGTFGANFCSVVPLSAAASPLLTAGAAAAALAAAEAAACTAKMCHSDASCHCLLPGRLWCS